MSLLNANAMLILILMSTCSHDILAVINSWETSNGRILPLPNNDLTVDNVLLAISELIAPDTILLADWSPLKREAAALETEFDQAHPGQNV